MAKVQRFSEQMMWLRWEQLEIYKWGRCRVVPKAKGVGCWALNLVMAFTSGTDSSKLSNMFLGNILGLRWLHWRLTQASTYCGDLGSRSALLDGDTCTVFKEEVFQRTRNLFGCPFFRHRF